jgi:SAM-dependent methyltransferase
MIPTGEKKKPMPLSRETAYTTSRSDIFALVPQGARAILDVGCSSGELGASLRQAVSGREVTGIEMDPSYCALAGDRLDEVICADMNNFDWHAVANRKTFDCIIFADVLEHLTDPLRHLTAAAECLRPNGVIVVSLPNIRHITAFYSIFVCGTFPQRPRGLFDSTHLRWFTYRDAVALLAEAGYQVESRDFNLRVRDRGDGRLNKLVRRVLGPVAGWGPVREFLAYQFCLRARYAPQKTL